MAFARRTCVAAIGAAVAATLGAAAAWACVPAGGGGSAKKLTVTPSQVKPGDQVTVTAPLSAATNPIDVRLNAANGPLLGTLRSSQGAVEGGSVRATFTVPLDTKPGKNALIAVQQGVKWDPVLLPVAAEDGTVPEVNQSAGAAAARGGGSGPAPWALGAAALVLGGVLVTLRLRARGRTAEVSRAAG